MHQVSGMVPLQIFTSQHFSIAWVLRHSGIYLIKMMPSLKTLTLQRLGIVTKTLQMSRIAVGNLISHLAFPDSSQRNLITNMLVFCRITDNKSLILVPNYESIYIIGLSLIHI